MAEVLLGWDLGLAVGLQTVWATAGVLGERESREGSSSTGRWVIHQLWLV